LLYVAGVRLGSRTRLTLLGGKGVHKLPGQDTIGLAQSFPQLADGLVRLFLSYTDDLVDPAFEVGGSAF